MKEELSFIPFEDVLIVQPWHERLWGRGFLPGSILSANQRKNHFKVQAFIFLACSGDSH